MDFLKTLLLYMTLTFAGSVQAAPTPEVTAPPAPTPTIAVVISATASVQATDPLAVTQTPAPGDPSATAVVTSAPQPTMPPNPAYKNLQSGDRGDSVKALQQRLKDLGYLTGEVDGAYGNQTRRAVMRFQYYNGLSQDGVAGKRTQTVLFESADVVVSPDMTPEPAATQTPEPEAAASPDAATAEPTSVPPLTGNAEDTAEPAPETTEGAENATEAPAADTTEAPAEAIPMGPALMEGAAIVVNSSGEALRSLTMADGVPVESIPPVYVDASGEALLDLAAYCDCLPDWTLTPGENGTWTLTAAGYTMALTVAEAGASLTVDGAEVPLSDGDAVLAGETLLLRASVLDRAMGAQTLWDEEENTLMIHYTTKELAQVSD